MGEERIVLFLEQKASSSGLMEQVLFVIVSDLCTSELLGSWIEFAAVLIGDDLENKLI